MPRPLVLRLGRLIAAATLALACATAGAQTSPKEADPDAVPPPPAEFSAEARREYNLGLKEARDLIAKQRYDEAIARLEALSATRPREPFARFLKAVALADAGRRDEAIRILRDLVAEFPELPEPRNNLAVLYAQQGHYTLAREELELALAAAPEYAVALENLADIHVRIAATYYERAATLEMTNQSAPRKLKLVRDVLAPPAR